MSSVADSKLYDVLGIRPNATEQEIKKAFRKSALVWHPDKWADKSKEDQLNAETKMKELTEAYGILSNPEKREQYDQFGLDGFKNGGEHEINPEDISQMFAQMGMGGFDGFGGFGGFGKRQQKKEFTIPDLVHVLSVNVKDTYMGSLIEFEVPRYNLKSGKQPTKEQMLCSDCKGKGSKTKLTPMGPGMMRQSEQKCNKCAGEGLYFSDDFFDKKVQKFSRTLPKGIMNNEKIVIEEKGHEIPDCFSDKFNGQKRTNIILVIDESREVVIEGYKYVRGVNRSPFNLALDLDIEPHEAICGTFKNIPYINGENICIKIPPGTIFLKPQHVVIVPKLGMPFYKQKGSFGELFVLLNVKEKFDVDDDKLKKIWKILTNSTMDQDTSKVLKKSKDEFIDSMTVEQYTDSDAQKTTDKNQRAFNKTMAEHDEDDDDEDDRGRPNGGCAQQ